MSDEIQTNISTTVENVNVYVSGLTSTNINVIGELVPNNNFETNVTTTVTNVDVSVTDTSATNIVIDYSYPQGPPGPQGPQGPPGIGISLWGSISGTLSAQTDLWSYLSGAGTSNFDVQTLTNYLSTNSILLCSLNVNGQILSAGVNLFDIFLTSETDSQTLSYVPSSYLLSISNGNNVNLSSINSTFAANSGKYESVYTNLITNSAAYLSSVDLSFLSVSGNWNTAYNIATAYQNVSGSFATNTTLNSVSSLLTPLTLTNSLTGQLVTNTTFNNYQTSVAASTATLLPTSIYQNASGDWQGTFTIVQQGSSNWYSASGAALNAANNFTQQNFLPLSGGTINGNLYILSSVYIAGSAYVVNAQDLIVNDPIIYIAEDNQTDILDIGIIASWTNAPGYPSGYQHGGLIRRADNKVWTLFSGATAEPLSGMNVAWAQSGIRLEPLSANFYGDIYGNRNIYGSLSSTNVIYAQGGNSNLWNQAFTTTSTTSGYGILTSSVTTDLSVGGISAAQVLPQGTTLQQFVEALFIKVFYPTFTPPSINVSSNIGTNVEAGTIGLTLTMSFLSGSINGLTVGGIWNPSVFQNTRSGVVTGYNAFGVLYPSTASSFPATSSTVVIKDGSNSFAVSGNHTQGPQPKDSKNNNFSTPLPSGSVSNSITVNGLRGTFRGADTFTFTPSSSDQIRIFPSSLGLANGSIFEISVPLGSRRVVVAYPSTLRDVTSIIDPNNNIVYTDEFNLTTVSVSGANSYLPINYKVYTYLPAESFPASITLRITI
jgi:hypothetical protein